MGRYKTHREPRRRGYDDDNYSSSGRGFLPRSLFPAQDAAGSALIDATVTWFSSDKGFGFVKTADGTDAFLHIRALEAAGHQTVLEGLRLKIRIEQGPKGQQVAEVVEVDPSAATNPAITSDRPVRSQRPFDSGHEEQREGTVKWFNAEKGFGFVGLDGGGKDVFIHVTAVARSGLQTLNEGQRVSITFVAGKKGPEAKSVREKA